MAEYRGYYIDGIHFNSKAEIDAFVKKAAIKGYRLRVQSFADHPDLEHSLYANEQAEYLHKVFGMTWSEIEDIEIEALKTA